MWWLVMYVWVTTWSTNILQSHDCASRKATLQSGRKKETRNNEIDMSQVLDLQLMQVNTPLSNPQPEPKQQDKSKRRRSKTCKSHQPSWRIAHNGMWYIFPVKHASSHHILSPDVLEFKPCNCQLSHQNTNHIQSKSPRDRSTRKKPRGARTIARIAKP